MASYRKRGKTVQAVIRKLGVHESASFPTMTMAKTWGTKREAEIIAGARGLIVTGYSVADMLDKYIKTTEAKGKRWDILRLQLIRREWAAVGKQVSQVSAEDVAGYREMRLHKVKGASVRREMVLLGTVFEVACKEWKWSATNPVRGVKKPKDSKPRNRVVSPQEYRAILQAAKYRPGQMPTTKTQWAIAAWCLALRTGMRAGELMKLEWRHVDLDRRVAALFDTKNGSDRQVPLFPRALRVLAGLQNHLQQQQPETTARVFADLTSGTVDALYRKVKTAAGVNGLTFHDSRGSAVTMFAKFLPILELARVIGHHDLNSLQTYFRTSAEEIAGRRR